MAPHAVDYDSYIEQIKDLINQGWSDVAIIDHLHQSGFQSATLRTLQRRLQRSNIKRPQNHPSIERQLIHAASARPKFDYDLYWPQIVEHIAAGLTTQDVVTTLHSEGHTAITLQTLERKLHTANIKRKTFFKETPELRAQIAWFYYQNYSDKQVVDIFSDQGHAIALRTVQRIRRSIGCVKRMTATEREEADKKIRDVIMRELASGQCNGYGRETMLTYLRSEKNHVVVRSSVARFLKELDPRGHEARKRDVNRRRNELIVPGPDYMWHLDGHDKLSPWGFQIYAAIDSYSRKIIRFYCGISNRTGHSVLRQYLETVRDLGYIPKILRTDHGSECPLMAEAHFALHRSTWNDEEPGNAQRSFNSVFYFGSSTHNQRIESWWAQLEKSKMYIWRNYFTDLQARQLFQSAHIEDKVSMLFVYMPIIRAELSQFVSVWNAHSIRKQPNRPSCAHGRPNQLYDYPRVGAVHSAINIDCTFPDQIIRDLPDWDIDEYLPQDVFNWCSSALISAGINPAEINVGSMVSPEVRLHQHAYMTLRDLLAEHLRDGNDSPQIQLSKPPVGGYAELEQASGIMASIVEENATYARDRPNDSVESIPEELIDYGDNFFYNVEDDDMLMPADD